MLASNIQKTIDAIYPVGALYLSMNATNPETLFGGTWKQLTADAYLKIVTSDAGESAKGVTNHKITTEQLPSHNHQVLTYTGSKSSSISAIQSPGSTSIVLGKYYGLVGRKWPNFKDNGILGEQQTSYEAACGYSNIAVNGGENNNLKEIIKSTGGGQAYYPGYIGIYVWYRTA